MFMNPKDSPFAVAMAIFLLGLVRAFEEYPRVSIGTGALVGIGFGLSFGSRVMGAFGAIEALAALALMAAIEVRAVGLAPAGRRCGRFVLSLVPAMLLAYAVMALVWPWSVVDPRNPFRAVEYFSRFFEEPWEELFGGVLIPVPDMPRSYVPTLLALKLPEIFLVLGFGGAAGRADRGVAARHRGEPAGDPAPGRARRVAPARGRSRCGRRCTTASGISCLCCRRSPCSAALPAPGSPRRWRGNFALPRSSQPRSSLPASACR